MRVLDAAAPSAVGKVWWQVGEVVRVLGALGAVRVVGSLGVVRVLEVVG